MARESHTKKGKNYFTVEETNVSEPVKIMQRLLGNFMY